ncbi:hypothetical protein HBH56_185750 [Parastagonospora nodorum]|uniref:Uncharacterized protein n=1 Tax=Phaeosphaeria nodorum (strain SN15 / ATCC MYA-4574 / FGSC 10173) TaxID=321614 RepID=A0A7U2FDM9_PHANO|nr:hypothetical protein HBH56_185750 [Parastagonospora nodorum]QRD01075.1 hypothetical protein JI435_153230 [Parastagonospora nodorum SN15]KAH3925306.1 hypothetical protein HBH54_182810 [Parastagonospora nodorum]KAH3962167.1 hypothetical protein HBH52_226210 [Parastagonospora nodorum]KAH4113262.1 hypothetical protein HBH47_213660 [Parastagonospora nodorum]
MHGRASSCPSSPSSFSPSSARCSNPAPTSSWAPKKTLRTAAQSRVLCLARCSFTLDSSCSAGSRRFCTTERAGGARLAYKMLLGRGGRIAVVVRACIV